MKKTKLLAGLAVAGLLGAGAMVARKTKYEDVDLHDEDFYEEDLEQGDQYPIAVTLEFASLEDVADTFGVPFGDIQDAFANDCLGEFICAMLTADASAFDQYLSQCGHDE